MAQVGTLIGAIHRANGVDLLAGDQVAAFEGTERLEAIVTAAGHRIPCDFAVAGIGIEPDIPPVAVAQQNGILADELCRASAADVYVAGDVANHLHPLFGRIRVEHFNNAEKQGAAAARSMLGSTAPYDYVHSFWSDQYQHKIEYVGHVTTWDEFVVRGSVDEGKLVGFYLVDGVVRAAVGLDRGGDPELDLDGEMAACARLVAMRARPAPRVLADERTDLWSLGTALKSRPRRSRTAGCSPRWPGPAGLSSSATISSATSPGVRPGRSAGLARRSISVSTAPGLRQMALMPCSLPSTAIASVRPITPYLETLYAASPGNFSVA